MDLGRQLGQRDGDGEDEDGDDEGVGGHPGQAVHVGQAGGRDARRHVVHDVHAEPLLEVGQVGDDGGDDDDDQLDGDGHLQLVRVPLVDADLHRQQDGHADHPQDDVGRVDVTDVGEDVDVGHDYFAHPLAVRHGQVQHLDHLRMKGGQGSGESLQLSKTAAMLCTLSFGNT